MTRPSPHVSVERLEDLRAWRKAGTGRLQAVIKATILAMTSCTLAVLYPR